MGARQTCWWVAPDDVFSRLAGSWQITRQISNGAHLDGTACFTPDNGSLAYHESGLLVLANGSRFQAERRYRYVARPGGLDVFFAGRDTYRFHTIDLQRAGAMLMGEGLHPCRDDLYRTRYVFGPDETFAIRHIVKGPRHDYAMETLYRRP